MPGAALDEGDVRIGDQLQELRRLGAHVLRPGMTGEVEGDAALERPQPLGQTLVAGDVDDVFGDVRGGPRQPGHGLVVGQDERPFELQHQRAGRHRRHDVVAAVDPGGQRRGRLARLGRHRIDVALLELRHAAAGGVGDLGLDPVAREHPARGVADAGAVVVHEAGRKQHRLAARGRRLAVQRRGAPRPLDEAVAVVARQMGVAMDARNRLQQRARPAVAGPAHPVGEPRHRAGQPAVAVGPAELALAESAPPAAMLDRPVAQHEVGKVEIERMRRHVGALGHEAHVAQGASVDHGLEVGAGDRVELAGRGVVDQIEQARKAVAQIEAAATAMADVEHAPELGVERGRVVERRLRPLDRVAGGGFGAAFLHRGSGARVVGERREGPRPLPRCAATGGAGVNRRAYRAPSGSARRATSRPSPGSRTSRRSRRNPRRAPTAPCRDTCPCIRGFRRRSPP